MERYKAIINKMDEMIKATKEGSIGILKVPQIFWNKLTYDEKAVIHKVIDKYSMKMVFKDNIVYLSYEKEV